MPALQPPARILVTGATGFIATWIVRTLLEMGFSVRGTARSGPKAEYLNKLFSKEVGEGRFETVIVKDIERPDAFDEAVKGVDGVAHAASPVRINLEDPNELIKPAVQGTVGVLQSTLSYNKDCKRIIVLSSVAAVARADVGRPLNEEDWNENSVKEVEEKGKAAHSFSKYSASKTLAERAAWDFYAKHKEEANWDLVAINPPFVYGPTLHEVPSLSALNETAKDFFNAVCKPHAGGKSDEQLAMSGGSRIDVRDLALAITKAFSVDKAGGERILVSAGAFTWQDVLDVAHQLFPESSETIYLGRPGAGKNAVHPFIYDTSKGQTLLNLEYRPLEDTVRDVLKDF